MSVHDHAGSEPVDAQAALDAGVDAIIREVQANRSKPAAVIRELVEKVWRPKIHDLFEKMMRSLKGGGRTPYPHWPVKVIEGKEGWSVIVDFHTINLTSVRFVATVREAMDEALAATSPVPSHVFFGLLDPQAQMDVLVQYREQQWSQTQAPSPMTSVGSPEGASLLTADSLEKHMRFLINSMPVSADVDRIEDLRIALDQVIRNYQHVHLAAKRDAPSPERIINGPPGATWYICRTGNRFDLRYDR